MTWRNTIQTGPGAATRIIDDLELGPRIANPCASLETQGAPAPTSAFDIDTCARIVHRGPHGQRLCNIDGCTNNHHRRGLCHKHYKRWDRWGDPHKVHPRYVRKANPKPRPKAPRTAARPAPKRARKKPGPLDWLNYDQLATTTPADRWWTRGHCTGTDPRRYFPNIGEDSTRARQTCGGCPVRYDCLAEQLTRTTAYDDQGIWGGTTRGQRIKIRRNLAARREQVA